MKLGAGHPMGPLALLDLVGLDVSAAIGQTIGESVPDRVGELIAEGALGRKTGRDSTPTEGPPEHLAQLKDLLGSIHEDGDNCSCDVESQRTPASSKCTRSGPLPPRAGRV